MEIEELNRRIDMVDHKLDGLEKSVVKMELHKEYHEQRMALMEDVFRKHMEKEEYSIKVLNEKVDSILKYKWVILGILLAIAVITSSDDVFRLIGLIK